MFSLRKALANHGVLGLNHRNAGYTLWHNPRHLFPLVDDKLTTKRLAEEAGLAVPMLYGVVEIERQVRGLAALLKPYDDFVIKPAQGSGGDGIVVITGRRTHRYRKASGQFTTQAGIDHHVSNILSGLYSLGGHPDKALIEYRVKFDPVFEKISFQGIPDIRIIVFLGVPVMAMVRLPTRMSDGKANLHQGAIGAGIDLATGRTLSGVWKNEIVKEHPDTEQSITNIQIPHWETLLHQSAQCYELTGLGYQGVDLVLDKNQGPLILELNARPGLNIQIANQAGLLPRLHMVEQESKNLVKLEDRVAFATQHFGASSKESQSAVDG
ncbi:MAG: alpha-L-glutamate ligase-like protein [Nitrospirales bacterium]|nr:MAG: alpha-L-glutamate ligase-like protein [Nitrospirales bacterium]